jgi:hypothetical protein
MTSQLKKDPPSEDNLNKKATPLRCFLGGSISASLALGLYYLTNAIATSFASKPVVSDNQIVVKISIAVRTLVVGVATLGTGVFSFVALGLFALGIQLLIQSFRQKTAK